MAVYVRHPIEQRILDDRERLQIPPVYRGRMPKPIADHIRRLMRAEGFKFQSWQRSTGELLCILYQQHGVVFDHYGESVTSDGQACFTCEPYGDVAGLYESALRFVDRFGLRMHYSSHSWHFPSRTVRFEYTLPDGDDK